jgi:hypothetical protein
MEGIEIIFVDEFNINNGMLKPKMWVEKGKNDFVYIP